MRRDSLPFDVPVQVAEPGTPAPGPALARHTDPETSQEAGKLAATHRLRMWLPVLRAIGRRVRCTDDFLLLRFGGVPPSTIRRTRKALQEAGMISDSGERAETRSGMPAIVWQLTAQGKEHLRQQCETTAK